MEAAKAFQELVNWRAKGGFFEHDNHQIFFIDDGDKSDPAILLIHGFPTSSWDWQSIWPSLSKNHRLVCLDMLGFGFSDKPKKHTYSIMEQADIVEALVRRIGLTEYHILAHDYGDTVTQELLARQLDGTAPGEAISYCFLNGGLFPETHKALLIQKLLLSPIGPFLNSLSGKAQFDKSFGRVFGEETKPSKAELAAFWHLINLKQGKHIFHNLMTYISDRKLHRDRWVSALKSSKSPISLINGSYDPVSGAHMVARYKELNCRLDYCLELENIGHYPQVEAPIEVSQAYLEYLKSP